MHYLCGRVREYHNVRIGQRTEVDFVRCPILSNTLLRLACDLVYLSIQISLVSNFIYSDRLVIIRSIKVP